MSVHNVEVMVEQGIPEEDARKIQDLTDGVLTEIYAMGVQEIYILRAIRGAYQLGIETKSKTKISKPRRRT